jgi:hypothetical protein
MLVTMAGVRSACSSAWRYARTASRVSLRWPRARRGTRSASGTPLRTSGAFAGSADAPRPPRHAAPDQLGRGSRLRWVIAPRVRSQRALEHLGAQFAERRGAEVDRELAQPSKLRALLSSSGSCAASSSRAAISRSPTAWASAPGQPRVPVSALASGRALKGPSVPSPWSAVIQSSWARSSIARINERSTERRSSSRATAVTATHAFGDAPVRSQTATSACNTGRTAAQLMSTGSPSSTRSRSRWYRATASIASRVGLTEARRRDPQSARDRVAPARRVSRRRSPAHRRRRFVLERVAVGKGRAVHQRLAAASNVSSVSANDRHQERLEPSVNRNHDDEDHTWGGQTSVSGNHPSRTCEHHCLLDVGARILRRASWGSELDGRPRPPSTRGRREPGAPRRR